MLSAFSDFAFLERRLSNSCCSFCIMAVAIKHISRWPANACSLCTAYIDWNLLDEHKPLAITVTKPISVFTERILLQLQKQEKASEKFRSQIFCVRNCRSIWIPAICLLRTRGYSLLPSPISHMRWNVVVRKQV